jgi:hypothetical protein
MLIVSNFARLLILGVALGSLLADHAAAQEDPTQCPDMPEHQKVLDEGQRELSRVRSAPGDAGLSRFPQDLPVGQTIALPGQGFGRANIDVEKLNLSSVRDFDMAQYSADRFLDKADYAAAELYYRKMLNLQEKTALNSVSIADTLENLAAVNILLGAGDKVRSSNENNDTNEVTRRGVKVAVRRRPLSETFFNSAREAVLEAARQENSAHGSTKSDQFKSVDRDKRWNEAAEFLTRAIKIRRDINAKDPDLRYPIMLMAAIEEWRGNLVLALSIYENDLDRLARGIADMDPWVTQDRHGSDFADTQRAFVHFCIRHQLWAVVRRHEADLLKKPVDSIALEDLLVAYSKNKQLVDATRLFETMMSLRSSDGKRLCEPGEYMVTLIEFLPNNDQEALSDLLVERAKTLVKWRIDLQWFRAAKQFKKRFESACLQSFIDTSNHNLWFSDSDPNAWNEISSALEARGWTATSERVFNACLQKPLSYEDLPTLKTLAKFYQRQKRYDDCGSTYRSILKILQADYPDSERDYKEHIQAFLTVSSLIDDQLATSSKDCAVVRAQANKLRADYQAELQRRLCLQMAQQLNVTGAELESKGQYVEATKLYRDALSIILKKVGADAPETAAQLLRLANLAAAQGQMPQADILFRRTLSIYRLHPNRAQHDYGIAMENYAEFLEKKHDSAQSKRTYEQARDVFRKLESERKS